MSTALDEQFEEGLESFLKTSARIAPLITGVYPYDEVPQGAGYPRLVYSIDSTEGTSSIRGESGLDHVTFTVSCQARSRALAVYLGRAVRAALQELHGPVGSFNVRGGVEFENREYSSTPAPDGGEDAIKVVDLTFSTWHWLLQPLPQGAT